MRFPGVIGMELGNQVRSIGKIVRRLPGVFRGGITLPTYFIKEFAVSEGGVKDLFDFPFKFIVQDNRRRWGSSSSGDSRRFVRFEEGYMEYRVDLHRFRELEGIRLA